MLNLKENTGVLEQQAKVNGAVLAIISEKNKLTYKKLYSEVRKTAQYFRNNGIKENDKVAFLIENNENFIINLFAVWKLGAIAVPINVKLLSNEIKNLFSVVDCSRILVQKNLQQNLNFTSKEKLMVCPFKYNHRTNKTLIKNIKSSLTDTAVIIFTSGTTGRQKGVEITFDNLYQSAATLNTFIKHSTGDIWLASLPFYHIGGFSIITRSILNGCTIVLPNSLKIFDIKTAFEKYHPAFISLVPTMLKTFLETGTKPHKNMKAMFIGGGPSLSKLIEKSIKKKFKIVKVYGSTETTSMVTAATQHDLIGKLQTSGKPIDNNKIKIVDENKNELPDGKTGEIVVEGNSVAKGYFNNIKATEKKFVNRKFYTGDFGFIDKDGFLFIEMRRDDLIISGGENINSKEVENAILNISGIKDAYIFKEKDELWGEIVCAGVVFNNIIFKDEKLKKLLKKSLAAYKIPKKFYRLDKIPRNDLGKVNKKEFINKLSANIKPSQEV